MFLFFFAKLTIKKKNLFFTKKMFNVVLFYVFGWRWQAYELFKNLSLSAKVSRFSLESALFKRQRKYIIFKM